MDILQVKQQGSSSLQYALSASFIEETGEVTFNGNMKVKGVDYQVSATLPVPVAMEGAPMPSFYVTSDGRVTTDSTDPQVFAHLAWVSGNTLNILNHE